ncbi:MAG: amidohydrolase family protein, partial [Anaerolineae bacterium]|nr:amidohydrolase family protein [Anaerolineae bacterium]
LLAYSDVVRMMSYAPELPGALELTRRLVELGIVPAGGHSAARDREVYAAVREGLRHAIHLWSGQSTTVREGPWRRPGLLEAALACDGLTGEIIADGKHLPPTLMVLAYRCKGPDRLCVVSDAVAGAGLPEGSRFRLAGNEYEVCDGVGMVPDRTAFAGSVTFLNRMVAILVDSVGVPLVEAVRMASLTPARIVGVADRKGSLEAGKDADLVLFEADLSPWRVMIGGRWVDAAPTPLDAWL